LNNLPVSPSERKGDGRQTFHSIPPLFEDE
jgi:hypothetical protein